MLRESIIAKILREFECPIPHGTKSQHFDDIEFTVNAEDEYCSLQMPQYKRTIKLIRDIWENGLKNGIGKPEYIDAYKGEKDDETLIDFYSRRITEGTRLCYKLVQGENDERLLLITRCNLHYNDH